MTGTRRVHVEVALQRGPILESCHRFEVAVVDAAGTLVAASASPERVTTFRSAAKPFQLVPLIEGGHADRFGFSDAELAVMASSHTGSAVHVALVRGILAKIGRDEGDLRCGYHEPLDPEARERLAADPASRSPLYHNCSGKHAGMLALAVAERWPIEGYQHPEHPLQRRMLQTIAAMCDLDPAAVPVAIDGCSVCVFGVPLARMALAYARLAVATHGEGPRQAALARIRSAVRSHPFAAGGHERLSTALIVATGGRLVAKEGAEGLQCAALPASGLGVAVKCMDGADRASPPAMIAVLERLDALSAEELERLSSWRRPVLLNHAGLEVGTLEALVHDLSSV